MIDNSTIIKVTNRDNGTTSYKVPDLGNLQRFFEPGETKDVSMEELRKLSWTTGGKYLLKNCFIVHNQEALKELLSDVEPEYFYTEEDIKILLQKGTLDQFMDCLDFAPEGVIELVKDLAVKLELNDVAKRQAILDKTGFNVTKAIEINKESMEIDEVESEKTRRAAPITREPEAQPAKRRAPVTSKYEVVSIKD